jgi:hypothetical protein
MLDKTEFEMLDAFYKNWVRLHSLPRTDVKQLEVAAQALVDSGKTIAQYRKLKEESKDE